MRIQGVPTRILKWIGLGVMALGALCVSVGLVVALLLGAGYAVLTWIDGRDPVSDRALIRDLEQNKASYERLIAMFQEDGMAVVHPDWMDPKDGISWGRHWKYKRLFSKLELDAGMRATVPSGRGILFVSTAGGLSIGGGRSKGYAWRPEKPEPLAPNLDSATSRGGYTYRRLDEDWYLYQWQDD